MAVVHPITGCRFCSNAGFLGSGNAKTDPGFELNNFKFGRFISVGARLVGPAGVTAFSGILILCFPVGLYRGDLDWKLEPIRYDTGGMREIRVFCY